MAGSLNVCEEPINRCLHKFHYGTFLCITLYFHNNKECVSKQRFYVNLLTPTKPTNIEIAANNFHNLKNTLGWLVAQDELL